MQYLQKYELQRGRMRDKKVEIGIYLFVHKSSCHPFSRDWGYILINANVCMCMHLCMYCEMTEGRRWRVFSVKNVCINSINGIREREREQQMFWWVAFESEWVLHFSEKMKIGKSQIKITNNEKIAEEAKALLKNWLFMN